MSSNRKYTTRGSHYCSAIGCSNARGKNHDLAFFRFPKEEKRYKLWVLNSGRQDLLNKDIEYVHKNFVFCSDHFEVNQCMNEKKNKLIWNAVPTLFGTSKLSSRQSYRIPKSVCLYRDSDNKHQGENFKRCLYVYCRNNTRHVDKPHMQGVFFLPVPSAQSNLKKRKLWLKLCGRMDLSKDRSTDNRMFYICSAHFEGGNGPTREHSDPIPHRVTLKSSPLDNNIKFICIRGKHVPERLPPPERIVKETESVTRIPATLLGHSLNNVQATNTISSGQVDCSSSEHVSLPEDSVQHQNTEIREHVDHLYSLTMKPSENKLPIVDPDDQYEITVLEESVPIQQFSLNDIRAKYPIPLYWTMCLTLDSAFFAKISGITQCLLVKFTVNKDMTTSLQALSRDLDSSHPLVQKFPKSITDFSVLDHCFLLLRCWNPCQGNNEKAYVSLFMQSQNLNGVYSPQTDSIHSPQCTLLTDERGSRCKLCKLLRTSLRASFRRFVRTHKPFWNEDENNENENEEDSEDILVQKNTCDATY